MEKLISFFSSLRKASKETYSNRLYICFISYLNSAIPALDIFYVPNPVSSATEIKT